MTDVFPPPAVADDMEAPDWGFSESPDNDIEIIALGDGYESREPKGLNYMKENWPVAWSNLTPEVGLACYDFLKTRVKLKAVLWTHPITGVQHKVVPQDVKIEWDTWGNAVLSTTFKKDHNPG